MPTRSGWLVLAGGITTSTLGRLLGQIEFTIGGIIALAAVVIAVAVRSLRRADLTITRKLSSAHVEAGQPIQVDLEIGNGRGRRTSLLRVHDAIADTRGVRLSLAPMRRGQPTTAAYRLPTTRRGLIELGPVRIDEVDAAGLAHRVRVYDSRASLLVHPHIEVVLPVRIVSGHDPMQGSHQFRTFGMNDEEFDGLREYQPGDDLRKVHWPSSARHDHLLVREFHPPIQGRLTLIIDTRPPGDDEHSLDVTTSIAASLAASTLRAGDHVRLQTTDGRCTPLLDSTAKLAEALQFLALLDSGAASIHSTVPAIGGKVVAISADPSLPNLPAGRSGLADRLRAFALITVDPSTWTVDAVPAGGGPQWIHLTGPGQLSSAWTRLWSRRPVMS